MSNDIQMTSDVKGIIALSLIPAVLSKPYEHGLEAVKANTNRVTSAIKRESPTFSEKCRQSGLDLDGVIEAAGIKVQKPLNEVPANIAGPNHPVYQGKAPQGQSNEYT